MSKEADDGKLVLDSETDRAKLMSQATGWLLEMELLNNPHMKNSLMLNVFKISDHIKDVELLIDTPNRKMLVFLELSGFGKLFKKRQLSIAVLDMLQQALASYTFRVIFDRALFEKALIGFQAAQKRMEAALEQARKDLEEKKKKKQETGSPQPASPSQEPVSAEPPPKEGTETKE